jgi:hypothetical protein
MVIYGYTRTYPLTVACILGIPMAVNSGDCLRRRYVYQSDKQKGVMGKIVANFDWECFGGLDGPGWAYQHFFVGEAPSRFSGNQPVMQVFVGQRPSGPLVGRGRGQEANRLTSRQVADRFKVPFSTLMAVPRQSVSRAVATCYNSLALGCNGRCSDLPPPRARTKKRKRE